METEVKFGGPPVVRAEGESGRVNDCLHRNQNNFQLLLEELLRAKATEGRHGKITQGCKGATIYG